MKRLVFVREFSEPADRVFDHFAEHENLHPMFGARVTRLRDGDDGVRNGVGSVRRLKVGPAPAFEETITGFEPDQRIEYRITKGSPLRDHVGELTFTPVPSGTRLEWTIHFSNPVPGVEYVLATVLSERIRRGLAGAEIPA